MRTIRWLMTTNLPAMGAMLLGGSYYGLIVRGGLVFAVTASKIYSGRIFAHIIVHPFGKRCFQNICVTFYKWDDSKVKYPLKSTYITIIWAVLRLISIKYTINCLFRIFLPKAQRNSRKCSYFVTFYQWDEIKLTFLIRTTQNTLR